MNQPPPGPAVTAGLRMKAWVCRACVLCVIARRRPASRLAKWLSKAEVNCPFCRAYRQVRGRS